MTSQQAADEALATYWAAKKLLDECFRSPTRDQYEDQLNLLREEMGKCVIFISDLPPHLSSAL